MNREIASSSKLIKYYDLKRNWEIHQKKVLNIKPQISTQNQTVRLKLKSSMKSFRKPHSRVMDIQFENRSLLKKLTERSQSKIHLEQSFKIDLKERNNRKRRFQDLSRTIQNEGILKRIKNTKTSYNVRKLVEERKNVQGYINLISRYNYKDLKPTKTILKFQMNNHKGKCPYSSNSSRQQKIQKENLASVDQTKIQKVIRIIPTKYKQFMKKMYSIKIVQFDYKIIIEISNENQIINCMEMKKDYFLKKFNGKFKQMYESICYQEKGDYFYLK